MHYDVMSDPVMASKPGMASVTNLPNSSASWVTFDELWIVTTQANIHPEH